jgi:hypothetical protein
MSRTSNYRVSRSLEVEIQCVGDLFTGLRKKLCIQYIAFKYAVK